MKLNLNSEQIAAAVRKYVAANMKAPTQTSGDAAPYFEALPEGAKITWSALNARLRVGLCGLPGGSSIPKFIEAMNPATQADFAEPVSPAPEAAVLLDIAEPVAPAPEAAVLLDFVETVTPSETEAQDPPVLDC